MLFEQTRLEQAQLERTRLGQMFFNKIHSFAGQALDGYLDLESVMGLYSCTRDLRKRYAPAVKPQLWKSLCPGI